MSNEFIFIIHSLIVSITTLIALRLGAHALVTLICTYCLLANFFVIKQITLFGLNATCADAFTIGATLGLNLLQEYFGRSITKKTISIIFFVLLFYTIVTQLHLWYQPNTFDTTQNHFFPILSYAPRIVIASFIVYYFAHTLDYYLYGALKKYWQHRFLVLRNYVSIALSQLFDTIAFSFFGLYGIVENIGHVIVISYLIKLIAIALSTPFVACSRLLVADKEK